MWRRLWDLMCIWLRFGSWYMSDVISKLFFVGFCLLICHCMHLYFKLIKIKITLVAYYVDLINYSCV